MARETREYQHRWMFACLGMWKRNREGGRGKEGVGVGASYVVPWSQQLLMVLFLLFFFSKKF